MKIILSYDYELFFGENTGTVDNCLIVPTNKLDEIASKNNVKLNFFIDIPYLMRLKSLSSDFRNLDLDLKKIVDQLNKLKKNGHDLQLHIHPHWYDSKYDGERWVLNTERYKLGDFSDDYAENMVNECVNFMKNEIGVRPVAFRAGGWSIEPFNKYSKALLENGVIIDSTVYNGGYDFSEKQYYDFRNSPIKTSWNFDKDPIVESKGSFYEIPITSEKINFTKNLSLSIMNRKLHKDSVKSFGDGFGIKFQMNNSIVKKIMNKFKSQYTVVSLDGIASNLLIKSYLNKSKIFGNNDYFVTIGHPKVQNKYSLKVLNEFITKAKKSSEFVTYSNIKRQHIERI